MQLILYGIDAGSLHVCSSPGLFESCHFYIRISLQIVQGSLQTALTSRVVTPVLASPYCSGAVIFCQTTPGHNHTMERLESGALQGVLP